MHDESLTYAGLAQDHQQEHKHIDKRSLSYIVRSGVAGGFAGCAAKTVVGPLDRVKILFQTSNPQFAKYTGSWLGLFRALRDINQAEGVRGLFRGHSATLLRIFPYAGIKFLAYEQIRNILIPNKAMETPSRRFASGSLAGLTSVFFTYPLEVIRVRMAFETKKSSKASLTKTCRRIYFEQPPGPLVAVNNNGHGSSPAATVSEVVHKVAPRSGLSNFYRGFSSTLLGMIPYAGMSFLTHDAIGDLFRLPQLAPYTIMRGSKDAAITTERGTNTKRAQLTAPAQLAAGAIAGLVSQTSSYPLEVIRRRMQIGGAVGDGRRAGIVETATRIFVERGFKGFFVGLTIGYLKTVPMTATSFYVYERGKWIFGI
ncbi:coenzyme A transporter [Lithohypha guttulata]|nr:coenzyme A transporter [Lithohypha guttulata]